MPIAHVEPRVLEDLEGIDENLRQVIYALERARDANRAHAARLLAKLDYSAEFPAEDADRLDEAIRLITVMGRIMCGATSTKVKLPAPSYATGSGDAYTEFWDEHEMLSIYRLGRLHEATSRKEN